jgi:hypothetical protein
LKHGLALFIPYRLNFATLWKKFPGDTEGLRLEPGGKPDLLAMGPGVGIYCAIESCRQPPHPSDGVRNFAGVTTGASAIQPWFGESIMETGTNTP